MKKLIAGFLVLFFLLTPCLSEAEVMVTSGLTQEEICEVGETYKGVITLSNTSSEPQEVKIYQTDYLFFCDGRNIYGEPGEFHRSNANWITLTPPILTVPPNGMSTVSYTVDVPDDENLVGTYWSMLMVEPLSEAPPEEVKAEEEEIKIGIRTVIRYGIQIVTNIGDSGKRELEILDRQLTREGEDYLLSLDLENTGEHWLRPEVRAEIYDEEGRLLGKKEGGKYRIYPGTSVRATLNLGALSKGKYKVLVVIDNGDQYIWGAQYSLNLQ